MLLRLSAAAALLAAALTIPIAAAPAAKPRLLSNPATRTAERWIGVLVAARLPFVTAHRAAPTDEEDRRGNPAVIRSSIGCSE